MLIKRSSAGVLGGLSAFLLTLLAWVFLPTNVLGQSIESPRFFKLNFQSLGSTSSPVYGGNNPLPFDSEQNFLIDASLRFPLKLQGSTMLLGKLDFEQEMMFGFYDPEDAEIDELALFQSSFSLIALHDFHAGLRLTSMLDLSSNSTKGIDLTSDALRFSAMNLLEWRQEDRSFGFGAVLTYRNSLTALPIVKYEGPLFGNWRVDALLPSHLLVTNRLSNDSRFFVGMRGSAGTYLLRDDDVAYSGYMGDHYKRITINGVVGYERQLTPWIGISAEMGVAMPYRSGIFDAQDNRLELHSFDDRLSPHFKVGFFLSLPD